MNSVQIKFEQMLLQSLRIKHKAGRYDPSYHVVKHESGHKQGKYRNPETQIAWEWYQKGLQHGTT